MENKEMTREEQAKLIEELTRKVTAYERIINLMLCRKRLAEHEMARLEKECSDIFFIETSIYNDPFGFQDNRNIDGIAVLR